MMDSEPHDQQAKQEQIRSRWTPVLDKKIADIVVEQIHKGNRSNAVFEKKAWNQIRDEFNKQTNLDFNNNQLRKHLDVLRVRYHSLQPDYNQKSRSTQAQSKLEPATTNDYLIYHSISNSAQYSLIRIWMENMLNQVTTGSCTSLTLWLQEMSPKDISYRKRKCLSEASSASERSGWSQELSNAMAGAILDMINCSTLQEVAKPVIDEGFSISNCIKALDKIEGIDNDLYYAALELFENLTFRE